MEDTEKLLCLRAQIPSLSSGTVYLNTGGTGALPMMVDQAMQDSLTRQYRLGRMGERHYEERELAKRRCRGWIARLLGCEDRLIALTQNTTEGINIALQGLRWSQGDEVITTDHEHPGAAVPLYGLANRYGVQVKVAQLVGRSGKEVLEQITSLFTERTKLVCLSHVSYKTGELLPIQELCKLAHDRGILVLVDGAQSFASIRTQMLELGCDFFSAPAQKWLTGPEGIGFLYIAANQLQEHQLSYVGGSSYQSFHVQTGFIAKEDASRYETGTVQLAQLAGLEAACQWFAERVEPSWAYERTLQLAAYLYHELQSLEEQSAGSWNVVTPHPSSGLVSLSQIGASSHELVALLYQDYRISIRAVSEPDALRISTAYYNTKEELDQLVESIRAIKAP